MHLPVQENTIDCRTDTQIARRRTKTLPGGVNAIIDMPGKLPHPEVTISFERLAAA